MVMFRRIPVFSQIVASNSSFELVDFTDHVERRDSPRYPDRAVLQMPHELSNIDNRIQLLTASKAKSIHQLPCWTG
jgi:hypothetical protein